MWVHSSIYCIGSSMIPITLSWERQTDLPITLY